MGGVKIKIKKMFGRSHRFSPIAGASGTHTHSHTHSGIFSAAVIRAKGGVEADVAQGVAPGLTSRVQGGLYKNKNEPPRHESAIRFVFFLLSISLK